MEILLILVVLVVVFAGRQGMKQRIEALEKNVEGLQREVQRVTAELSNMRAAPAPEKIVAPLEFATLAAETLTDALPPVEPPESAAAAEGEAEQPSAVEQGIEAVLEPAVSAPPAATPSRIENNLGSRWAVWVGGVALALGGVLMVRYSIENGLISPAVRLLLAALFGLLLMIAGEVVRRRGLPAGMKPLSDRVGQNAMIPGILTAAGGVSLFATFIAAHQLYGFIGGGTAFLLMALTALSILGLSLFHGQALAGLGLVGGLLAPALVEPPEHPNLPLLMAYVVLVWFGSMVAARFRGWNLVPAIATFGAGLWGVGAVTDGGVYAPLIAFLVLFAATVLLSPDSPRFGAAAGSPEEKQILADRVGNWMVWAGLALTGLVAGMLLSNGPAQLAGHRVPMEALLLLLGLGTALALRRDALPAVPIFGLGAVLVTVNTLFSYMQIEPDT